MMPLKTERQAIRQQLVRCQTTQVDKEKAGGQAIWEGSLQEGTLRLQE